MKLRRFLAAFCHTKTYKKEVLELDEMDLRKKIGQQLIVGFHGKEVTEEIKDMIHTYHVGSIILFARNIGTPEQVLNLTTDLQKEAKSAGYEYPLLICVDQENGVVRRLGEGSTVFPGAMSQGATDKPEYAYEIGLATAKELKDLGINWNLAPVLDVNNNPENPVIGVRSFGEIPEKVAQFGRESMKGIQDASVMTTLKHFPGHGDTNVDSHLDLPAISHGMERLEQVELVPFKECIKAGADTIMTAHVYFPELEPEEGVPATLSRNVITGLLREKMHYQGVITTDCMEMDAISETIGTEKGAVEALKAGVDMVMISHMYSRQKGAIEEITKAVEAGEIDATQIEQSNKRIWKLKEKYLNWENMQLDGTPLVPFDFGSEKHRKLAEEVYRHSVTIVKGDEHLPLDAAQKTLVLYPDNETTVKVEDKRYAILSLVDVIQEYQPTANVEHISHKMSKNKIDEIVEKAKNHDTVIVGTLTVLPGSNQITLLERLMETDATLVVIAMRNPYDLAYLPEVPVYINTYEFTHPALNIAAGAIFGNEQLTGKSPVTLKPKS